MWRTRGGRTTTHKTHKKHKKVVFKDLEDGQHFMFGSAEHTIVTHLNIGRPYRTNHVDR